MARSNYSVVSSDTVLSQGRPAKETLSGREFRTLEGGDITYLEQRTESIISQRFWKAGPQRLARTGGDDTSVFKKLSLAR